jgi:hypothetical protein
MNAKGNLPFSVVVLFSAAVVFEGGNGFVF